MLQPILQPVLLPEELISRWQQYRLLYEAVFRNFSNLYHEYSENRDLNASVKAYNIQDCENRRIICRNRSQSYELSSFLVEISPGLILTKSVKSMSYRYE
jgi:hypothetical protein